MFFRDATVLNIIWMARALLHLYNDYGICARFVSVQERSLG